MRVNLTGFTNAHKTGTNRKGVIGLSSLLKDILVDQGYEADYELEDADLNIVCVLDLSSINASNATTSLKLLKEQPEKSVIAFDDWNIKGFYKTIDGVLAKKAFSKTHHTVDYREVLAHLDVLQDLADGKFKAIYPAYKTGDHELLGIRGEKFCLDPSIYIEKDESRYPKGVHKLLAVHASLAPKWSDLNKKKYSIVNLKGEKEETVYDYYKRHRIVITPPHYHDGSGWFRNRYALANKANAVIVEDNSGVFGDSYRVERKTITEKNIDSIFDDQDEAYYETIMTKDEITAVLREITNKVFNLEQS